MGRTMQATGARFNDEIFRELQIRWHGSRGKEDIQPDEMRPELQAVLKPLEVQFEFSQRSDKGATLLNEGITRHDALGTAMQPSLQFPRRVTPATPSEDAWRQQSFSRQLCSGAIPPAKDMLEGSKSSVVPLPALCNSGSISETSTSYSDIRQLHSKQKEANCIQQ